LDGDDLKEHNRATDEAPLSELVSLSAENWKHVASFQHRCEQTFQQLTSALQNYERLLQQAQSDGHEVLEAWIREKHSTARDPGPGRCAALARTQGAGLNESCKPSAWMTKNHNRNHNPQLPYSNQGCATKNIKHLRHL